MTKNEKDIEVLSGQFCSPTRPEYIDAVTTFVQSEQFVQGQRKSRVYCDALNKQNFGWGRDMTFAILSIRGVLTVRDGKVFRGEVLS